MSSISARLSSSRRAVYSADSFSRVWFTVPPSLSLVEPPAAGRGRARAPNHLARHDGQPTRDVPSEIVHQPESCLVAVGGGTEPPEPCPSRKSMPRAGAVSYAAPDG